MILDIDASSSGESPSCFGIGCDVFLLKLSCCLQENLPLWATIQEMRLISCDGQQQSPEEGWVVVDMLIVLMLMMVVVDMGFIGINSLIMMSACGVTNKVCECYIGNP